MEELKRYSYRVQVDSDYIELCVSKEPVELTWEWRISERYANTRTHRFETFEAAKKAGLHAILDRVNTRANRWLSELDNVEGEILQ